MYRKTNRYFENARKAKERKRLEGPAPDYPAELPNLRRVVIVIDYDFGKRVHVLKLFRSNRVDCYRVEADGRDWRRRVGWSGVLEGLRKAMPRVMAA